MSSMEVPQPIDKVAERTAGLAGERGRAAWHKAMEFFKPHIESGLVSAGVAAAAAEAEAHAAIEKFTIERNQGLHNDHCSISRGFTAILSQSAVEYITRQLEEIGSNPNLNSPQFEQVGDEPQTGGGVYRMTLPQGVFAEIGVQSMRFFEEVKFINESGYVPYKDAWGLIVWEASVCRIEGAAGELWQNPEYNPDGTLRG